jgi:prophage regulatory protein
LCRLGQSRVASKIPRGESRAVFCWRISYGGLKAGSTPRHVFKSRRTSTPEFRRRSLRDQARVIPAHRRAVSTSLHTQKIVSRVSFETSQKAREAYQETARGFQQRRCVASQRICFVEWSFRMSEQDNGTASNKSEPRRMLNEDKVLEIVPVSRTTLYRMEKAGRFPRSTYISPNRRIWYADEIIAWQNAVDEFNPNRGRGKGRTRASN